MDLSTCRPMHGLQVHAIYHQSCLYQSISDKPNSFFPPEIAIKVKKPPKLKGKMILVAKEDTDD